MSSPHMSRAQSGPAFDKWRPGPCTMVTHGRAPCRAWSRTEHLAPLQCDCGTLARGFPVLFPVFPQGHTVVLCGPRTMVIL